MFLDIMLLLNTQWKRKSLHCVWLFSIPWNSPGQNTGVAFPFSRGSSQPRDRTHFSRIAGGFFTSWTIREAQEYWGGQPIPFPGDLPDPGIEPGSPALQADSLPAELPGTPTEHLIGYSLE